MKDWGVVCLFCFPICCYVLVIRAVTLVCSCSLLANAYVLQCARSVHLCTNFCSRSVLAVIKICICILQDPQRKYLIIFSNHHRNVQEAFSSCWTTGIFALENWWYLDNGSSNYYSLSEYTLILNVSFQLSKLSASYLYKGHWKVWDVNSLLPWGCLHCLQVGFGVAVNSSQKTISTVCSDMMQ